VIEEAPSTAIDPETRRRMGEQAVQLARKVGYFSAGTVEFLVDVHKNFYFLEMNTRLQVEHPITEYITGLDLVELMIRVAEGKQLPFTQEDVKIRGWAVECRVYAEDPKLYLPSIGRLNCYREPDQRDGNVRCDTGIVEGSEISIYYDPLICKLSTFGSDRSEALKRMSTALDTYVIRGVTHNIPLLREVISNKKFIDGHQISTMFLAEEFPDGFDGHRLSEAERDILSAVAVKVHLQRYRVSGIESFFVKIGNDENFSKVSTQTPHKVSWDGHDSIVEVLHNGTEHSQYIEIVKKNTDSLGFDLRMCGTVYSVQVLSPLEAEYIKYMKPVEKADLSSHLLSPMPGQILTLSVVEGQTVQAGAPLITLEAMKMQNVLRAQRPAKISKISVKVGQKVGSEDTLMEFEYL
jgi:propionyl-CoA carboxylase alpha chain